MSAYDASIRINTEVNNDDLLNTQKEIDNLTKKLDSLNAKGDKLQELGVSKQSKQWKSLTYDVAQTEMKLEDAKEKLERLNEVDNSNVTEGFEKAEKSGKKMLNTLTKGSKQTGGLFKTLASRLKGIALSLLIFNWITKGFNAMVKAMQAGFQNLAKYSSDYNATMSGLKSECAQLKNSLASAFEPIANVIIPYITRLMSWLNSAADTVARFLAALSGKNTYTKATKQVINYAKSLDTASASAKNALASFDSINVLTSGDSGTMTAGGETTGAAAFETAEVGTDMQAVMDTIAPFRDMVKEWIDNLDFEPIITSFEKLKTACEPLGGILLDKVQGFMQNVLLPLSKWVIEDALPVFFDMLAAAIDAFNAIWEVAQPYLDWLWNNFLLPIGEWVADAAIEGIRLITEAFTELSDWAKGNRNDLSIMSSIILGFLGGIVMYFTIKKIVDVIKNIKGAISLLGNAANLCGGKVFLAALAIGVLVAGILYLAANWNKLSGAQKCITILGALAAAAIACAVAIAIFHTTWSVGIAAAAIIGGLALLGLTAACLQWNGQPASVADATDLFGDTGSGSPLPALATGGITYRPTTALIGEAGREAVLPLENNTEWMDVLADRINGGGPNRPVYLQIDGKTFARLTGNYYSSESTRVGVKLRTT